jgi:hypothetical protein
VDCLADGGSKNCPERRGRQQEGARRPVFDHQYQHPPGDGAGGEGCQGVRYPTKAPVRTLMVVGQRP